MKMKEIKLTNGMICNVDDIDYNEIAKYNWYSLKSCKTIYARTFRFVNGKNQWFYMHQLVMGTIGIKKQIDHKDHNGLNNQRDNLRISSQSDNMKNRTKHRGNSKYTGVNWHLNSVWLARININGKQKYLGVFNNEIDAARAYNKAALATGNTFYNLNEV